MDRCSHVFRDGKTCLHCGVSMLTLQASSYREALQLLSELRMRVTVSEKDTELARQELAKATAWREDTIELLRRSIPMLEKLEQGAPSLMCSPDERMAAAELANDINAALAQGHV
jgi:hypothetical protein